VWKGQAMRDGSRQEKGYNLLEAWCLKPVACARSATVIESAGQKGPDAIAKRGSCEDRKIGLDA